MGFIDHLEEHFESVRVLVEALIHS